MSFEKQMETTEAATPLEFHKLNEQGMSKGIPSSMMYQVYYKDGLEALAKFVSEYKGRDRERERQYLDQHHRIEDA